jgi:hypothetical protein
MVMHLYRAKKNAFAPVLLPGHQGILSGYSYTGASDVPFNELFM